MFSITCNNVFREYPKLKILRDKLLSFWLKYPPVVCHGYLHSVTVALKAYDLVVANSLGRQDLLFAAGLVHDVGRSDNGIIVQTPKDSIDQIRLLNPYHETGSSFNSFPNAESVILFFADKFDQLIRRGITFIFYKQIPLESAIPIFEAKKQNNIAVMDKAIKRFNKIRGLVEIKDDYLKSFIKFNNLISNKKSFDYYTWARKQVEEEIQDNYNLLTLVPLLSEQNIERLLAAYKPILNRS